MREFSVVQEACLGVHKQYSTNDKNHSVSDKQDWNSTHRNSDGPSATRWNVINHHFDFQDSPIKSHENGYECKK